MTYDPYDPCISPRESSGEVKFCVQIILFWIAAGDGTISKEEQNIIEQTLGVSSTEEMEMIFKTVIHGNYNHLEKAFNLCKMMNLEHKCKLLELALMVAMSDGILAIPEIHILYLLTDVLGTGQERLHVIFKEHTGRDLPKPSDISDKGWWEKRSKYSDSKSQNSSEDDKSSSNRNRTTGSSAGMAKARALSILGFEENATLEEIRKAYRRLANVHHPDKFHCLGPEAVNVATETFKKINEAYRYLVNQ